MTIIIALLMATLMPLGFLYAIKAIDFYQTGNLKFIAISGVWGVIAYLLAAQINPALISNGFASRDMVLRYIGPIIEEVLKGIILIVLIRRTEFKYFLDGAIYGFTIGIGFAIFENFEYVLGHSSVAIELAISRVLSTNLIHATGSALIGIALGLARFDRSRLSRALYLIGGLVLAITIHSGFNNMVNDRVALLFAVIAGFTGAGAIALAARRGFKDEESWVHEKITDTEGVTRGEAEVVQRLDDVNQLLAPLAERFGVEKASQCEKFLFVQAQLAIQTKMMDKLQDENMRRALEKQMKDTRKQMDVVRRQVGSYAMLYLRNIFPDNDPTIMNLMKSRIEASAAVNKDKVGTGIWDLNDRLKINQLKRSFLFQGLSDKALDAIAQMVREHKLVEDDVLVRRGETGDSIFMINTGWFKVVTEDANGGELIINKTGPGEIIGEMALLDEAPRSATVIALAPAKVFELKKDAFQEILDQRPDVALALINGISSRLRFSTTYIQKAIDWSQKIAAGDYSFIEYTQQQNSKDAESDADKADQLLSAFFQMVESVKAREDDLKQRLEKLELKIDESRRKQEFEELTGTDFYANLKAQAKKMREQRIANQDEE
ncbi:MAG TPA: PrsW family glutamic-type intramembrane protease [Anaerolineales bacterium]|nr:PrsW family glutamic-type intramembrane protease [Anaerolineales bacterium]